MRLDRKSEDRLATNKAQAAKAVQIFNMKKRKNSHQTFLCDSSSMQQNSRAKLTLLRMEELSARLSKKLI